MKKRITIIGAGAVGLELAARITAAGVAEVTVVAKEGSDRLRAVQERGAHVQAHHSDKPRRTITVAPGRIQTVSDVRAIREDQDYVFIAVKGQDITPDFVASTLTPLIEKNSNIMVVMAQNGVPIWMNHGVEGLEDYTFPAIDSDGEIAASIGVNRIAGMVLQRVANTMDRPGVVVNAAAPPKDEARLIIGMPDGRNSKRLNRLAKILNQADMSTEISDSIREPLFLKLMLNIGGCVTAITGQPLNTTFNENPQAIRICTLAIDEARHAISRYYDLELPTAETYLQIMSNMTGYKPSILKDLEDGKITERGPILDTLSNMRHWEDGGSTPVLDMLSQTIGKAEVIATQSSSREERLGKLTTFWQEPETLQDIIGEVEHPVVPSLHVSSRKKTTSPPRELDVEIPLEQAALFMQLFTERYYAPPPLYTEKVGSSFCGKIVPSGARQNSYSHVEKTGVSLPPKKGANNSWTASVKKTIPIKIESKFSSPNHSDSSNSGDEIEPKQMAGSVGSTTSDTSLGAIQKAFTLSNEEIRCKWDYYEGQVTSRSSEIYFKFSDVVGVDTVADVRHLRHAIINSIKKFNGGSLTAEPQRYTNHISFSSNDLETLQRWHTSVFGQAAIIQPEKRQQAQGGGRSW